MTAEVPDFDAARLADFMQSRFGPDRGVYGLERISGGQSNPSFFLDYGDYRFVLRKQPNGPILQGAHAIDREFRVMRALAQTALPVPRMVHFHDDASALGTPFYLMDRLEGRVFTDTTLGELRAEDRAPIFMAVADTMAQMHKIRPELIGLGDYGKPGSYFARQIARWDRQYRASPSGPIPQIEQLFDWLTSAQPEDDGRVSICHGDFRLGNLMFHPTEPRVIAVLDWELSTLGHPLADLGYCCMPWHTAPDEYGGLLGVDLEAMALPSEADFVAHYMAAIDDPAPLLPFHKAFALYRFAVIFVGIADRVRAGSAADPAAQSLAPLAVKFAKRGLAVAGLI